MQRALTWVFVSFFILSGCNARADEIPVGGMPSPTPFQPAPPASDSLYAGAAPTPLSIPTLTPTTIPTADLTLSQPTAVTLLLPINPLTGLPASDPELLKRRPMSIKVANYPRYVRPQSGLTLADQVYEYYIEDGLTRFVAVFYGNDSEWVGPVRSGRFFDENILRMYQSFLIFKYADKRVLEYFRAADFADLLVVPSLGQSDFGPCPPFFLLKERKIEVYNNSYFNTTLWQPCVEKYNLPSDPPSYRTDLFMEEYIPFFSLPGTLIHTYYSVYDYNYWEYDSNTGQYYRFQETGDTRENRPEAYAQLFDRVTGQAVHASNVVYLFAYHTFANPYDEDDEVYHIDLTTSGEAYVFRDGIGIIAKWIRSFPNQPLTLTDNTGAQIYLKPGITFYQVIGTNSSVDQGDGEWTFRHATP